MKDFAENNPRDYAKILASMGFLVGFLVILYPFVLGGGQNVLIAILSVVLLRQTLNVLPLIVGEAVGLVRNRHNVDALVFPDVHLEQPERKERRALRVAFRKEDRERDIAEILAGSGYGGTEIKAIWADATVKGLTTFMVTVGQSGESGSSKYQLQVYSPQTISRLENERFLVDHVHREHLKAPAVVARYSKEVFECQLLEFGEGHGIRAADWRACQEVLLRTHWACRLPKALVQAFAASRGLLDRRLHEGMVARLEVAADTGGDRSALDLFEQGLLEIQHLLRAMPLYVRNSN